MTTTRPENWQEMAEGFGNLVVSAMATYVVCTNRVPDFRDWIRTTLVADAPDDPEVKEMFQKIGLAPDEIIEDTVRLFTMIVQDRARKMERNSRYGH